MSRIKPGGPMSSCGRHYVVCGSASGVFTTLWNPTFETGFPGNTHYEASLFRPSEIPLFFIPICSTLSNPAVKGHAAKRPHPFEVGALNKLSRRWTGRSANTRILPVPRQSAQEQVARKLFWLQLEYRRPVGSVSEPLAWRQAPRTSRAGCLR